MVIERGPDLTAATTPAAVRDLDYTAALASDRVDRIRVRRTATGEAIDYMVGTGVGGSSAVNGMLMEHGDLGQYGEWGWRDALPAFHRVLVPGRQVTDDELGPIDLALLAATSTARHAVLSASSTSRVTVVDAYLDPARDTHDVSVLAGRSAVSVVAERGHVTGVALSDGSMVTADAVVLCAGAIATPLLLLRSALHVRGAGEGLTDHPSATVNVRLHAPQPDSDGLVTTGVVAGDDRVQVTAMRHVGVAAGEQALGAVTVALLRPRSRGRVALGGDGAPLIEMSQYRHPADLAEMIDAVGALGARVADLGDVVDEVSIDDHGTPISALRSQDDIARWLMACSGTYVHPAASCPMGSVVDDDGRVAGTENLFIADASVFPEIPAAPTYLPTMMLAERLAQRLAAHAC